MPLFWKKFAGSGSIKSTHNQSGSPKLSTPVVHLQDLNGTTVSPSTHHQQLQHFRTGTEGITRSSRLSQNIEDVVKDIMSRRYFLSFLESRGAAHMLNFLSDVYEFETSSKNNEFRMCKNLLDETSDDACDKDQLEGVGTDFQPNTIHHESTSEIPKHSEGIVLLNSHTNIVEIAVKIFTTYLAKDSLCPIGVSDELRDDVTSKICCEDGHVDPSCFSSIQKFVSSVLQKEHFNLFLQSVYYCKYQLDVLTAGTLSIVDVLYSENALVYFMEFMEQESQRELVEFWLTTNNFYQHYASLDESEYDATQIQDDAMVIYEKYFSLQASCPLGFGDQIRYDVEQNICRIGGPLPTCFDSSTRLVLQVLEQSYLGLFLGSQIYVKYLTELVNLVQTCTYACERRTRSGSDASSEHSTHTLNTLLAMDGSQPGVAPKKIIKRFEDEDMQIDTSKFVPDALWRRPLSGKLRLGFVNNMGQFITEFEPEPDKRRPGESRFTKAVKKFVYKDEDKAKEEMAMQVARMIIHEVVSVTLKSQVKPT